ncbi:SDR family NAD(P)-dependent oxidoreductase [Microbacterium sp. NPDC087592]|uniref:SDR family NAD(P)-dependent oxidoreductase n=1 Tax=Microbacterium sp. NPDC087592 TaxID=3364193 RepID=UPI0038272E11
MTSTAPRVALITGASSGIGAAAARAFNAAGYRVALAREATDDARELAAAVVATLPRPEVEWLDVEADLMDPAGAVHLAKSVAERWGRIDVVVANAARTFRGPFFETDLTEWDAISHVNVRSTWLLAKESRAHLVKTRGSFIAVSSVLATLGSADALAYTTSKAAIAGMIRSLARELGPFEVRANCVSPGAIQTEREATLHGTGTELDESITAHQAIKRRGQASDVAAAILFLAGDDATFITGQDLVVDGGWLMR